MKSFKRLSTAQKHSGGNPIVRVGNLYMVGDIQPLTEIALLSPDGYYAGHVTAHHLDRLGNANHAEPRHPIPNSAFRD